MPYPVYLPGLGTVGDCTSYYTTESGSCHNHDPPGSSVFPQHGSFLPCPAPHWIHQADCSPLLSSSRWRLSRAHRASCAWPEAPCSSHQCQGCLCKGRSQSQALNQQIVAPLSHKDPSQGQKDKNSLISPYTGWVWSWCAGAGLLNKGFSSRSHPKPARLQKEGKADPWACSISQLL